VGGTVTSNKIDNTSTTWAAFTAALRKPVVTTETYKKYMGLDKDTQDRIKDVGYYVFGRYSTKTRKKENLESRDAITLDLDHLTGSEWIDGLATAFNTWTYALHSTHKHSPEKPRLRQVFPLTRPVNGEEYEAVARKLASLYNIDYYDKTTFQFTRVMHYPSHSVDGEYVYKENKGVWVDPDTILALYTDWTDITQWPAHNGQTLIHHVKERAPDPRSKSGWIGAFCRAYSISDAMDLFIPDVYSQGTAGRYTYLGGTTSNGAVTYDNDTFLYSHHESDPCSGRLVNSFDLVRLHKFGALDKKSREDTPVHKRPSYIAMLTMIEADPELKKDVARERAQMITDEFDNVDLSGQDDILDDPAEENTGTHSQIVTGTEETDDAEDDQSDILGGPPDLSVKIASAAIVNPQTPPDWESTLDVDKRGMYTDTLSNISKILAFDPEWGHNIRFNEFGRYHVLTRRVAHRNKRDFLLESSRVNGSIFTDRDVPQIKLMLERKYSLQKIPTETVFAAVEVVGTKNRFHPVLAYFKSLPKWDGVPRAETLLVDYLGAEDNEYTRAVTRKFLCGAINRIKIPGSKWDYMLILEGLQGIRKGMFLSTLAKNSSWFCEGLGRDLGEKAVENMTAKWICELPEGEGLVTRRNDEEVKAFVTRTTDRMRPKYGRVAQDYPRQCVFVMTTNRQHYLTDATGHRRFWPVRCDMSRTGQRTVNIAQLANHIDQIWAEALLYWQNGEQLWLDPRVNAMAEKEQEKRELDDGLASRIAVWLDNPGKAGEFEDASSPSIAPPKDYTCVREIWVDCFGEPEIKLNRLWSNQIHEAMTKMVGWDYEPGIRYNYPGLGRQRSFIRRVPYDPLI
jgi:hypothetical protein